MINVLHVSANDNLGGAAKASYRINNSFKKLDEKLIKSNMRVINKTTKDINKPINYIVMNSIIFTGLNIFLSLTIALKGILL